MNQSEAMVRWLTLVQQIEMTQHPLYNPYSSPHFTEQDGAVRVEFTVDAYGLATVVDQQYWAGGKSHEEVTAWLDTICTNWREMFVEDSEVNGAKRWRPRSHTAAIDMRI